MRCLPPTPALLLALAFAGPAQAAGSRVFLEQMTSAELQAAIGHGATTIIIPVGGTEQSGPHLALGKHNERVKVLAGRVAEVLGNTLVAPVLAYVPEGSISPPRAHMRWAGTISIPPDAFKSLLDGAARSLRQHGFTDIVLIGDHGGYQDLLAAVATKLNRDWAGTPAHAHFVSAYYDAAQAPYAKTLRAAGLSEAQIGTHAGAADTALMLAIDPAFVAPAHYDAAALGSPANGVAGDPRPATAALGRLGTEAIVKATVAALRSARAARP